MRLKHLNSKLNKLLKEITVGSAISSFEEPIMFSGFKPEWKQVIYNILNNLSFSNCIKEFYWGIHGLYLIVSNKCPESFENMRLEFRKFLIKNRLNLPFVIKYENIDYLTEGVRLSPKEDKFIFQITKIFAEYLTTKDKEKKKELKEKLKKELQKITVNPTEYIRNVERDKNIKHSAKMWGNTAHLKALISRKIRDMYIQSLYEYIVEKKEKAWSKLPEGWTKKSLKKFWDSLGGDFDSCVKKISDTDITNPEAFCASLSRKLFGEVI